MNRVTENRVKRMIIESIDGECIHNVKEIVDRVTCRTGANRVNIVLCLIHLVHDNVIEEVHPGCFAMSWF